MTQIYCLKVFTDARGNFGNPLALVIDEKRTLGRVERQALAAKINYSETIFINDISRAEVQIFNPQTEVEFAGHAVLGAAWFLTDKLRKPVREIRGNNFCSPISRKGDLTEIVIEKRFLPPWNLCEIDLLKLKNLDGESLKHTVCWAWTDEKSGEIRARTFAPDWGIAEDEANGSGSAKLALQLGRESFVKHGRGSEIFAQPLNENLAKIGGRVELIS